jgi:hypothetical protein
MNQKEQRAIEAMLQTAGSVVGELATVNELGVAQELAKRVCDGYVNQTIIENASREERKRVIAIAFNLLPDEPFLCQRMKWAESKKCDNCKKVCCHNKVLQRRFAAEMYPDFKVY